MNRSGSNRSDTAFAAEADRLIRPDSRFGVPVPAYEGNSLPNIASTLVKLLGGGSFRSPPPLPALADELDPFHGRRPEGPVVVLLVDGLGWQALLSSAARGPNGPAVRWLSQARPITSVFPTTTTVALTSLSTGASPGQHGVVGHRVYLPHFGTVVEMLRMSPLGVRASETLVGPEWSPQLVSGVPSIFRDGLRGVALSRDRFEGSGFTRLIYDGAEFVPIATSSDLALGLVDVLTRPDPPSLVFAYWDDLDVAMHIRGPHPGLVDMELERVDAVLSFVHRHLPSGLSRSVATIITGDHGQVPMEQDRQLVADRDRTLLSYLSRPPSGDRRATFFSARKGQLSALREALLERLPPGGRLIEIPEAIEGGLFGPPPFHPELSERLGDLLVLMPSPGGVSYTVPGGRSRSHMRGAHGGLEVDELLVPLIAGTFATLSGPSGRAAHLPERPSRRERR